MKTNDSLIELALRKMRKPKRARTIEDVAKDVFKEKGYPFEKDNDLFVQFNMDFMLSGHFICCGEDKNGVKLWDLKNRQPSSLLDKEGSYLDDLYKDDEEVLKNELTDEVAFNQGTVKEFEAENYDEDDDEDNEEEHDDIEEELLNEGLTTDDEETITEKVVLDEDDLDDEDDDDDELDFAHD
ncbi:MAG TPA: hypothetical protein PLO88_00150 [Bacilli bacterium]|nr:hypothetical protein [Bacilli bacterium]HPN60524.1 hypothetical protein [Bacilli bacterium]HPX84251.1 hypothetical protein [Bacilli bacterium]HQC74034.1 hypothetical protein [Bacilli bacterium]